jgi:hypothetical protein
MRQTSARIAGDSRAILIKPAKQWRKRTTLRQKHPRLAATIAIAIAIAIAAAPKHLSLSFGSPHWNTLRFQSPVKNCVTRGP